MFPLSLATTPAYIACRSDLNSKYLRCQYAKSMGGIYMEASAERVAGSARTRFILEICNLQEGLVHVRCGYNRKYWAPRETLHDGGGRDWIIGAVDEPDDEDPPKSSSTVFKIVPHEGNSIRFYHPGLGKYACIVVDKAKTSLQLRDEGSIQIDGDRRSDTFSVIGVSNQKELPKYVVFKGDNGCYLQPEQFVPPGTPVQTQEDPRFWKQQPWYLRFGQDDKSELSSLHTTSTNDEGIVRIKCESINKFWRQESDFIEANSEEDNFNDRYTMFKVLHGHDYTSLLSMGNSRFCKRFSSYGHRSGWDITGIIFGGPSTPFKESCLSARAERMDESCAKLHVEEPIVDRNISDIQLHVDEARIYGAWIVHEDIESHPNTSDSEGSFPFSRTTETTRESKWETSVSMKRVEDIKTFSKIGVELPFVKDAKVTLGAEVNTSITNESTTSHGEGGSEIHKEQRTISQIFHMPPKTTLRIKVVEKRYHCDVPFSYKQWDLLPNGHEHSYTHDDGIYSFTISEFTAEADKPQPLT